jgi:hypothetical protein
MLTTLLNIEPLKLIKTFLKQHKTEKILRGLQKKYCMIYLYKTLIFNTLNNFLVGKSTHTNGFIMEYFHVSS